jgi:hypothetical protein
MTRQDTKNIKLHENCGQIELTWSVELESAERESLRADIIAVLRKNRTTPE